MERKPQGYWTKERCKAISMQCESRAQFRRDHYSAYQAAQQYGWMDDVCRHMPLLKKPNGYWTKLRCAEAASGFSCRNDFSQEANVPYQVAHENGWLDDICSHMHPRRKPLNHWTKDRCAEIASGCKTVGEFYSKHASAYGAACENRWLDDICSHLDRKPNDSIYIVREELPCGMEYMVKVGVTTSHVKDRRLRRVSEFFDKPVIVLQREVSDPRLYESRILKAFARKPDLAFLEGRDGYTELRMMTAEELGEAVRMVGVA